MMEATIFIHVRFLFINQRNIMMFKKNGFILFLLLSLLIPINAQKEVNISGKILNNQSGIVRLLSFAEETEYGKSSIEKDGTFAIYFTPPATDYYRLEIDKDVYLILIIQQGETITLKADTKKTDDAKIEGSPHSSMVYEIRNGLQKIFAENPAQAKDTLVRKAKTFSLDFMKEHTSSLSCLFLFQFIDMVEDSAILNKVFTNLQKDYGENPLVAYYYEKYERAVKLAPGHQAPEISLSDSTGKSIKLSDFRNKYVLIDFWASWCGPCRRETPSLLKLYGNYHSKGLEILGVSLDDNPQAWLNYIHLNKLTWPQVSDLKAWKSQVVQDYSIEGIPMMILLDKQGKVIAKGRTDSLEPIIAKLFE
jgi:thiol-disulfide isomerase/thioredoxin